MSLENEIFENYAQGKTLVFPTEVAARSNMKNYVLKTGKALFADCSISFDTFKNKCTRIPSGYAAATQIHRMVFAEKLFANKTLISKLKYYYNPKYPQSASNAKKTIAKQISHFAKMAEYSQIKHVNSSMFDDISLIRNLYGAFLEENKLYEKDWLEPDFNISNPERYILVFPGAIRDKDVEKALKYVKTLNETAKMPVLSVYKNSLCELRACVRKIYKLLSDGVSASDIAITLTDFDNEIYCLEEEAFKRDIILNPVAGKPLSKYKAGSLFEALGNLYNEKFNFTALKNFLLNPSFPFARIEENREIVRQLIENNTYGGIEVHITKTDKPEILAKLRDLVVAMKKSLTVDELRKAVNAFQDEFFAEGSFRSTGLEEDNSVFRKCIDTLDELEKTLNELGIREIQVFDLYLSILSQVQYTLNLERPGIKVYRYPVSCACAEKYHFVPGLSDERTKLVRTVSEYIEDEDSQDISKAVLKSFACSENPCFSCSKTTFSGEVTIAALFAENNNLKEIEEVEKDIFSVEQEAWEKGIKPDVSASRFLNSCFDRKKIEDTAAMAENNEMPSCDGKVELSATSLNTFERCPYLWMCNHLNKIKECKMEPVMVDYPAIGKILHSSYEQYFNEVKDFDSLASEEYRSKLNNILGKNIDRYSKQTDSPDSLHIFKLSSDYKDVLALIHDDESSSKLFGYQVVKMEKDFSFETPDYKISGAIDCMLKSPEGDYAVIDFKKNKVDKNSVQLLLYAKAMENLENIGKLPVTGMFFSIDEHKFVDFLKDSPGFEELIEDLDARIERTVQEIKNGNFIPAPSKNSCSNCEYSRICRARYVIK